MTISSSYQSGNRCSFNVRGSSSAIHEVDLCELFGGGETHAYTVLKIAALATIIPTSAGFQSHKPIISESLSGVCRPFVDEKRAQSLLSAVIDVGFRSALEMKQ
jgi:hypothetical protein